MDYGNIVQTEGLTRRFGDLTAVDGLSLEVPKGCVFGFLGPNGAGKSTTIRMLLGLIRPHSGHVVLFGQDVRRQRRAVLRRLGALVESPSLYGHLTGVENLDITRRLLGKDKGGIPRILDLVGLEHAAARRVSGYSQGMKQRLALGLALLGGPELLILDEPTNGLDPAGILEMRELIREMPARSGISVLLSSHLLNEVEQIATHIAVIQNGRLKFQGSLSELQKLKTPRTCLKVNDSALAVRLIREMGIAHVESGPDQLIFVPGSGEEEAGRINSHLVTHGVRIFHLEVEAPTLEDLFLSLTEEERESS